ncbi:MAG: helix-turn-helix domain-containing protein [Dehalococcoidia bacterium]|nr:helix-turn-helix domain-containing protein [Dehalococcoidia bacterium]
MEQTTTVAESRTGLLSTAQAAEMLGVHPNTIRNWADAGLLNAFRIGPRRDRRFLRADLDTFLTSDAHA